MFNLTDKQFMALQKKGRVWVWIGSIIGILILSLSIAALYLSSQWKPLLTEKIKEGVYTASNGLYLIDFKNIHLNLVTGSVVLDSLKLTPDTNAFKLLVARKKAPSHLFRIKASYLKLSRIKILAAYFDKKINLNSIVLTKPSIDMVFYRVPKRIDTLKDEQTLYQQISKSLRSIRIGTIKVVDADFDYYNGLKKLNAVKHLNINVKDILVDSLSQYDSTRVLHSKNIGFNLNGYRSLTKDKMYTVKIDSVSGSINSRTLKIRGLKMIPMYNDLTFSRKSTVQKDRYDLSFATIDLTGVDFIKLNTEGSLKASHLEIGPAKVAVFLNRELPPPDFNKGRNFPHIALKRLPIETILDTLSLSKVDIAYTEYNPKTKERGTLKLDNLTGSILNLTNDSLRLSKNNHAKADLTAYILGVAKMNVKIDFNLTDAAASFSYIGHVSPFNLKVLNPLSKSLGEVEIESGKVKSVDFNIYANQNSSKGRVSFKYTDLKVKLLEEGEDGKKEKKKLLSFLANTILIKDDNPSKGEAARVANITWSRVPQASFFNLMWKSVFVGIREIVGIGVVPIKAMEKPKASKKEER
ncbi:hypothetical protein WG904_10700 [Pedobacter sp. Du54]|uniref:hypothetical protein n=1 Tax=Pedobacter anseongensis TaxID=3133439 RepID=UPI0030A7D111